jgi:hypothetical protein
MGAPGLDSETWDSTNPSNRKGPVRGLFFNSANSADSANPAAPLGGCPRSLAFGDRGQHEPKPGFLTHHKIGCPILNAHFAFRVG